MDRKPPHSLPTERAVLSAWMRQDAFAKSWQPEPHLFFDSVHRKFADGLRAVDPKHRDTTSLAAELQRQGHLDAVGGIPGIVRLVKTAPEYRDPWQHVVRLQELAALRETIRASEKAIDEAYRSEDIGSFVQELQAAASVVRSGTSVNAATVKDAFRELGESLARGDTAIKYPCGVPAIDTYAGGLRKEHVAILGAKTSWGKSSFAVMCLDECLQRGKRPLVVSFEDSKAMYASRLLARRAKINAWGLREMKLSDEETERAIEVINAAEDAWLYLDGRGKTVERMAFEIRSMCMSEGIELVISDYVQRIKTSARKQDRRNEITHIFNTLTDTTKTSGVAGLVLSQLRRDIEGQPNMNHLKEAGDLENGAEMVLIGFNDDVDERFISIEKAKDGIADKTIRMNWSVASACFLGEHAVQFEPKFSGGKR